MSKVILLTAFLAMAVAAEGRQIRLALVGDSLAYGAGDEERRGIAGRIEPELRTRGIESVITTNVARVGATTTDLAERLRDPKTRKTIESADAIVLSIGANDVRRMLVGEEPLRSPFVVANGVLKKIEELVADIRSINADAHIVILGGYVPVADADAASALEPLVAVWDMALMARFTQDQRISVVRLSDIVNRPERLSRIDSFHPGGEAYQETARRIADVITAETE